MWNWIKIPKGAALLAFLLPWMTVSCSGTKLAEASGYGLAFGKVTAMSEKASGGGEMNILLILAIVVIIAGLALSFIKGREAAKLLIGTSAGALVLILAGTHKYTKDAIMASANKGPSTGSDAKMQEAAAAMIQVEWHFGYYLAVASLLAAAVMAVLVMLNKDDEAEARMREAASNLSDTAHDLAGKASEVGKDLAGKAAVAGKDLADKAAAAGKDLADKASDALNKDDGPPKA